MQNFVDDTPAHARSSATARLASRATAMATAMAIAMSCVSPSAFAQNTPISSGYLTGVWKDNIQCTGNEPMVFFPDNTMSSAGSTPVKYAVTGPAQFTMQGPGGSASIQAQHVNPNQMVVTFQNNASVFYRCGTANARTDNDDLPPLSASYITGSWGYNGNCEATEVFSAGGQFRTSNRDQGTWTLSGNLLRLTVGNGNSVDFSVQVDGPGNMTLTQHGNGHVSQYTRCS